MILELEVREEHDAEVHGIDLEVLADRDDPRTTTTIR
jgi:hypothetical protein